MHHERIARGELEDQIFRASGYGADRLPFQSRGEVGVERVAQGGPANEHAIDALAFHGAAQQAADVFDFGKLWHLVRLHRGDTPEYGSDDMTAVTFCRRRTL